ncbi:MAG: hypothetical protein GXP48_07935 [Acidobacteria bacterium]|nr:hypothetical protein [Acidobacteriota bacterium]
MKHGMTVLIACALVVTGVHTAAAQIGGVKVTGIVAPDSTPVRWQSWVSRHAPLALVVWASWLPRSKAALNELGALQDACRRRGLHLALVDVSEPLQDGSTALAGVGIPWVHDRHGSVLKHYRLVHIPCLLILDKESRLVAQLDVSVAALQAWEKR